MRIDVSNESEFLNCVYDFVLENYEIVPRDFTLTTDLLRVRDERPLIYTRDGQVRTSECQRTDPLHVHPELNDGDLAFCTIPELLAFSYLDRSIFHRCKPDLIRTMQDWLPSATANYVSVRFDPEDERRPIVSYLEPSYAVRFLTTYTSFASLRYYFISNIVHIAENSYTLEEFDKTIMVRRRRSRSRSRSRSPGRPRRYRSRSRSRSRGRSGSRERVSVRGYNREQPRHINRRRRRSRSRSR